jgi:regulator of nucleoside diphosphate kinase
LEKELSRAEVVAPKDVPADVVTMNSKVSLRDLDTGDEMDITLVFPKDADITQDKVSVLAPIGTAMLGYRVGDVVEWTVPDGVRRLHIEKVLYQPEASGDLHL